MSRVNPTHPGRYIQHDCIEPLGLTITAAAEHLGVSRRHLSNIIHAKSRVSAEMAIRLSQAFGGTPRWWLQIQTHHDIAQAERQSGRIKIKRIKRAA